MMNMYVVERDAETGIKFGICHREYYVFFMNDWHKINKPNIDEAKRVFRNLCFETMIDNYKKSANYIC